MRSSLHHLTLSLFLALGLTASPAIAQQGSQITTGPVSLQELPDVTYLREGTDVQVLASPQRTVEGRLEVIVFFWYGSPWIAEIYPYLQTWERGGVLPPEARVQWVPLIMDDSWALAARTFYALEELGQEEMVRGDLIRAAQQGVIDLNSPSSILQWMTQRGISAENFERAFNSPLTIARVNQLPAIARAYHARSTPTFVVDGRYRIAASEQKQPTLALAQVIFMVDNMVRDMRNAVVNSSP